MADQENNEQEQQAGGGGKKSMLMLIIVGLIALVAGAGGMYVMVKPDPAAETLDADNPCNPCSAANPCGGIYSVDLSQRLFAMEPFIVNVTGHEYARYLKVKVELEAESLAVRDELEMRLPQVRDGIIVLLSAKRLSDITDFEGKALLKEDIKERINGLLTQGAVKDVLFTDFVVQ